MALKYAYKPGRKQSMQANAYFLSLASEVLENSIADMDPTQYLFEDLGSQSPALRVWSANGKRVQVPDMLPWLRAVSTGLDQLSNGVATVPAILPPLMRSMDPSASCFVRCWRAIRHSLMGTEHLVGGPYCR